MLLEQVFCVVNWRELFRKGEVSLHIPYSAEDIKCEDIVEYISQMMSH